MPVSSEDWMKALSHISEVDQLKATVKGSVFAGVSIGILSTICGVFLGPIGLLLGGIIGSILMYYRLKGTYKPLVSVLKDLTPKQMEQLLKDLTSIRSQITASDYVELILLLQGSSGLLLKKQVFDVVFSYLKKALNIEVRC